MSDNLVYNLFSCAEACLDSLYIMAFTSGIDSAGSNVDHAVEVELTSGILKRSVLPDLPGDDYEKHKGDLWKISFEDNFHLVNCVRKRDIKSIIIRENGNDGWNIETIVTFLQSDNDYELATSDFNVYKWIDGDHEDVTRRFFKLTLV